MEAFELDIPASEIVRWIREERRDHGGLDFYVSSWRDYVHEEDFDRKAYGAEEESYDLVSVTGTLNIEPRVERNYWILQVVFSLDLGPQLTGGKAHFSYKELSLDEFEREFISPSDGKLTVRVDVETPVAKSHFDRWMTEMQTNH